MNKCSPVEMRKNLASVEQFKIHGVDFVAIPVKDELHKVELIQQSMHVFDELIKESK